MTVVKSAENDGLAVSVAESDEVALVLRLRALRGSRTLGDAAAEIGIRPDELSKIERGLTSKISWSTLLGVMRAYRCTADDLLAVEHRAETAANPIDRVMAAMRLGVLEPVPPRRVRADRLDEPEELGEPSEAVLRALREPVGRNRARRTFTPATR